MTTATFTIDRPGVYDAVPNAAYQADPVPGGSLSHSGARKLLPPSCPALYRHWADGGQAPKAEFDIGHAVHALVLGGGPELVVVDADDWRTKLARETRDEAHERGAVPILRNDYDLVRVMADSVLHHPIARALFNPERGKPEQSLFWRFEEVWLRARCDWLPQANGRRLIVPDLKTTKSASPEYLRKALYDFGYYTQAAWYLDAVTALGLDNDSGAAFVLVFVEKTPPYLVTICEPDGQAVALGREQNERAIAIYRECKARGEWPGYADDVIPLSLPGWASYNLETS